MVAIRQCSECGNYYKSGTGVKMVPVPLWKRIKIKFWSVLYEWVKKKITTVYDRPLNSIYKGR